MFRDAVIKTLVQLLNTFSFKEKNYMSHIQKAIETINNKKEKVLSVFVTAGFPARNNFVDLAFGLLDAGADMLEIGIPFSDPLADGQVIQQSSQAAIESGVATRDVLSYIHSIKKHTGKPIIAMGYANPILHYGVSNFFNDAAIAGADGVIVPDIPIEEYDDFFNCNKQGLDVILLATSASGSSRVKMIDKKSSGFVYCVSVLGITGARGMFTDVEVDAIRATRARITNNKMLVGFGISTPENIKQVAPHCDGVIVGSAIIKSLMNERESCSYENTFKLVRALKTRCRI